MATDKPLRSAEETAKRILVLASVCAVANEIEDTELKLDIIDWLKEESLWSAVGPRERRFLETEQPTEKKVIYFSWNAEMEYVIGWALGLEKTLLPPIDQASTGDILDQLPAPGESTKDFIASAKLRSKEEIYEQAQELYDAHSRCRSADMKGIPERHGYDIEVAQERHHAINWLICYEDADWDGVPTDT